MCQLYCRNVNLVDIICIILETGREDVLTKKITNIERLIWQTKRLFQCLNSESNSLLQPYALTASQRAVLEFLDHKEPETLANIARNHAVSRQHIQQICNDLVARNLVETVTNPAHKRSFLVRRTGEGKTLFKHIQQRETIVFAQLGQIVDGDALQITTETLKRISDYFQSANWQDKKRSLLFEEE